MTGNEFRQFHDSSVLEFEKENGRHGGPAIVHTLAGPENSVTQSSATDLIS